MKLTTFCKYKTVYLGNTCFEKTPTYNTSLYDFKS